MAKFVWIRIKIIQQRYLVSLVVCCTQLHT
jgi:hypothetical protein